LIFEDLFPLESVSLKFGYHLNLTRITDTFHEDQCIFMMEIVEIYQSKNQGEISREKFEVNK